MCPCNLGVHVVRVRRDLGVRVHSDLGVLVYHDLGVRVCRDLGVCVCRDLGVHVCCDLGVRVCRDLGVHVCCDLGVRVHWRTRCEPVFPARLHSRSFAWRRPRLSSRSVPSSSRCSSIDPLIQ